MFSATFPNSGIRARSMSRCRNDLDAHRDVRALHDFVRVLDEIFYSIFLLLPSKVQFSDLSGIVTTLLQRSGYPRSFYAAPEYAGCPTNDVLQSLWVSL